MSLYTERSGACFTAVSVENKEVAAIAVLGVVNLGLCAVVICKVAVA